MIRYFITFQFLKFLIAGGIAATCNITIKYFIEPVAGYLGSIIISYALGTIIAYLISIKIVFSSNKYQRKKEILHFFFYNACMVPIVITTTYSIDTLINQIKNTNDTYLFSHIIGVAAPVFISFLYHKFITFGEKT
jgi:putative flippase GtrA